MACSSKAVFEVVRTVILYLSLLCLPRVQADVDFFISQDSLHKDLRLSFTTDVYLIKDGEPAYLLSSPKGFRNLVGPLRPSIESVAFTWFANPLNARYSIDVTSSDTDMMPQPKLTIAKQGTIRHSNNEFKVFFPCSGKKSGIVDLGLSLNYTEIEMGQVQDKTMKSLNIRVQRECLAAGEDNNTFSNCAEKIQSLIYSTVAATVCFLVTLVLLCIYCLYLRKSKSNLNKDFESDAEVSTSSIKVSAENGHGPPVHYKVVHSCIPRQNNSNSPTKKIVHPPKRARAGPKSGSANYDVASRRQPFSAIAETDGEDLQGEEREALMSRLSSSSDDSAMKQIKEPNYQVLNVGWSKKLAGLIVPSDKFKVTKDLLGKGDYSLVFRGAAWLHRKELRKDEVAVKELKDKSDVDLMECFVSEAILMRELKHNNVIQLLGVHLSPTKPPQLILQYTKYGNLHFYLTQCRTNSKLVLFTQLVSFGIQIAKGMEYIASKQLVHRNLASRNCLVHKDKTIKISDFGLARHVRYSRRNKLRKPFPVKWTALEGLTENIFTEKSDVWSCGVVLWEIITHALEPYEDVDDSDMIEHITNGNRLSQPETCPDELFNTMSKCWLANTDDRPSFSLLAKKLKAFERTLEATLTTCETTAAEAQVPETTASKETASKETASKETASKETARDATVVVEPGEKKGSAEKNGCVVTELERESAC